MSYELTVHFINDLTFERIKLMTIKSQQRDKLVLRKEHGIDWYKVERQ